MLFYFRTSALDAMARYAGKTHDPTGDAMATTRKLQEARNRAAERKAVLDARRAEHDKLVLAATARHIEATDAKEAAQAAALTAQHDSDAALVELLELGLPNTEIAQLCDIDVAHVRTIKRQHHTATRTSTPDPGHNEERTK